MSPPPVRQTAARQGVAERRDDRRGEGRPSKATAAATARRRQTRAEDRMKKDELKLRAEIIQQCRWMNASGLNQGTSGNISARYGDRMLITPSATPYDAMEPEMIASMPLESEYGAWEGPLKPSTEWRFHLDIMRSRADVGATVHTHSTYATVLAICGKPIPACHYMMAAFGGMDVRCAPYATFGTAELSKVALEALEGRTGCLLANHGMIATGATLAKAMWLAVELETIAKQYYLSLSIGGPNLLGEEEIADTVKSFGSYGLQDDATKTPVKARAAKASNKTAAKTAAKAAGKSPSKAAKRPRKARAEA
jgi:L-fuculose-phosphate aldolase